MEAGTIVRCRGRDWVLLPSVDNDVYRLRPLTGLIDEEVVIHKELSQAVGYSLPEERVRPSSFPLPSAKDLSDISDAASAYLLWQSARLTLREGAAPFRSLGRISIRPRVYQFVPLLMALRLDPVRLFIADDVGVGKTIEALMVVRELIDCGRIRRFAVLCPPYLCDQWEKELREKFNLDAEVFRSGTISRLERQKPPHQSIYEYYPYQVISIDWVKLERNKALFLQFCPELVVVDEVHGAAEAGENNGGRQQRHQLLLEVAKNSQRHLILLTATPHSGIESAFCSLLGLLNPKFRSWEFGKLDENQRIELARHFVQRTRKDIERQEKNFKFPRRISVDETYKLSEAYYKLFQRTYDFCYEIIHSGEKLEERRQRVRYWGALALLRCVMSSPKCAITALEKRTFHEVTDEEDFFEPFVFESSNYTLKDENPIPPIGATETTLPNIERRKLKELQQLANEILNSNSDNKLISCVNLVKRLLREKFNPIIWCRYVATVEYVAEKLKEELNEKVQVIAVTGRMADDERREKIDKIKVDFPRVLVATDCLSEGINLQDKFTAVIHYDLPWNPNRMEQREGRVDRWGQNAEEVKVVRFYSPDNPVDGTVIEVILRKADEIHKALGTYVPIPEDSETVMQALIASLFLKKNKEQGELFEEEKKIRFHEMWNRDVERERSRRTLFAQHALKPEEVERELNATDAVLGDPDVVREFVLNSAQRLGIEIKEDSSRHDVFLVDVGQGGTGLPEAIASELSAYKNKFITFSSPTPPGVEYVGRNHKLVSSIATYLLEEALAKSNDATVSRCGVIRTTAVSQLTVLLLLRSRYLTKTPSSDALLLSEEVLVFGYPYGARSAEEWLSDSDALELLSTAKPDANIPSNEKRELVELALQQLGSWQEAKLDLGNKYPLQKVIKDKILQRAKALEESHKRIRKGLKLHIREFEINPQLPPDLLGLLILQPMVAP